MMTAVSGIKPFQRKKMNLNHELSKWHMQTLAMTWGLHNNCLSRRQEP
jgi:hypothetical protein